MSKADSFHYSIIDYADALDTTYPPNGRLADCPRLIPPVNSLSFLIDCTDALDTTYPPNGELADFFRLLISSFD